MNEYWPEPVDPAEIASEWTSPKIDIERDARIGDGVFVHEDIGDERGWIERALWFLAWDGTDACGVVICRRHAIDPDLGWVAALAVRREWRRRGIGHALLAHAFGAFAERNLTRAGLGVDAESPTGANSLNEDVGMSATRRFDIYERALA